MVPYKDTSGDSGIVDRIVDGDLWSETLSTKNPTPTSPTLRTYHITVVGDLGLEHSTLAWILAGALTVFGVCPGLTRRRSLGDDSHEGEP